VESRSLDKKAAGKYLAKYISKSFHLRNLYEKHGLKDKNRAYHFYHNLYEYEQRTVLFSAKSKIDQLTGKRLNNQQNIFRHYDYENQQISYFYRTNKRLLGQRAKPVLIKKNYCLGTRAINTLSLLNLATKSAKKEAYLLKKPLKPLEKDFQEFLITRLLLLCKNAEFTHLPLEAEQVPKENTQCNGLIYTHFQTKPVLRFTFLAEQAPLIRAFIEKLDTYAEEFAMEESKEFLAYPITHDFHHQTITERGRLCGCEIRARNQYLDN